MRTMWSDYIPHFARVPEFLERDVENAFQIALFGRWKVIDIAAHREAPDKLPMALPSKSIANPAMAPRCVVG